MSAVATTVGPVKEKERKRTQNVGCLKNKHRCENIEKKIFLMCNITQT